MRAQFSSRPGLATLCGVVAALALASAAAPASADDLAPVTSAHVPRVAGETNLRPSDGAGTMNLSVVLQPRDPQGLADFSAAVSTPGNAVYGQFLAKGEFAQRFGATPAAVASVRAALRARGLQPGSLSPDGLSLPVVASVDDVRAGLAVSVEQVGLPSGREARTVLDTPQLPSDVAPLVQTITGLSDVARPVSRAIIRHGRHPRLPARRASSRSVPGAAACSGALAARSAYGGSLTFDQINAFYGTGSAFAGGNYGQGATVGLFELEPYLPGDVSAFSSCFGTTGTVTNRSVDGGAGTGPGQGETALDIDAVLGAAPKANVIVYQAPNDTQQHFDDVFRAMVADDTAQVLSTSWGTCEAAVSLGESRVQQTILQEAAAQGQTVLDAIGDSGSEGCYPINRSRSLAGDALGAIPEVTGVGGTHLTPGASPAETVWNDAAHGSGAGGGGVSTHFAMPSWQRAALSAGGTLGAANGTACGQASTGYCRQEPDISADASPYTGYVVFYNGSWTVIGGTSGAAPLVAGYVALINQCRAAQGTANVGLLNPALYALQAAGAAAFNDISVGNNDYLGGQGGRYAATAGFDMASGLGTPHLHASDGSGLLDQLCGGGAASPAVATTAPAPPVTTTTATPAPAPLPPAPASGPSPATPPAPTATTATATLTLAAVQRAYAISLGRVSGVTGVTVRMSVDAARTLDGRRRSVVIGSRLVRLPAGVHHLSVSLTASGRRLLRASGGHLAATIRVRVTGAVRTVSALRRLRLRVPR